MDSNTLEFNELTNCASDEDIKGIILYCNRYFSDLEIPKAQYENYVKLSNYVKRNNIIIGDIESEVLLSYSKINNMFKSLESGGLLIRCTQFCNLTSLMDLYCINNNITTIEDDEFNIYDRDKSIDLIKLYLNEIKCYRILSFEEEKELVIKAQNGDIEARNKLASHNLRLVVFVAKHYRNFGLDFGDLIQFGNEGLLTAIKKFDASRGFKFSTYATYWIKQYITRGIAVHSRNIRVSVGLFETIIKIKRIINNYIIVNNGKIPTDKELCELTGISIDRIIAAKECMEGTISLSTPSGSDEKDSTLEEIIMDPGVNLECVGEKYYANKLLNQLIDIASLSEKEMFVIKCRYGFFGNRFTLEEIGKKLDCSRENVKQIEDRALYKLQLASRVKNTYDKYKIYMKKNSSNGKLVFRYNI